MSKFVGVRDVAVSDEILDKLNGKRSVETGLLNLNNLYVNQYIVIKDLNNNYTSYKYRFNGQKFVKLRYETLSNTYIGDVNPRNVRQELLFDLLLNDDIPVKLVTGSMGSGKTFLCVNAALHKIQQEKHVYRKIVYIRNNVEVANTEKLGALPNGLKDKLMPFILPIQDCLGGFPQQLEYLEKGNQIEYVHLGYCRGRNFSNSVIIVSESENLTREHVQLLIGRVGENSIIIFEGDLTQTDKKIFETNNGIRALREVLGGNPLFGEVQLEKVERSLVAELSKLF